MRLYYITLYYIMYIILKHTLSSLGQRFPSVQNLDTMFSFGIKYSDFQIDRLKNNPLNMYIVN